MPKSIHSATVTATPKSTTPAASRFNDRPWRLNEAANPDPLADQWCTRRGPGRTLNEGTEGRVQIEAEVGKEKAGKERSSDAQADPPDPDASQRRSPRLPPDGER